MNLYNDVKQALNIASHALTIDEIIAQIKANSDIDVSKLNYDSVASYIWKHSDFEYINGLVFLTGDVRLRQMIQMYLNLTESLRGIRSQSTILSIKAVLLFQKRLSDIKDKRVIFDTLENYSNDFSHFNYVKEFSSEQQYVLSENLNSFDTSSFSDVEFACIYEYLLNDHHENKSIGSNITPQSVTNIISRLIEKNDSPKSIYDPVAGFGGLLARVVFANQNDKELHIKGSEINSEISFISNLIMYLYGYIGQIVKNEDCFVNIRERNIYDYIIGDLPLDGITNSFENKELYWQFNVVPPKSQSAKRFNSLVLLSYSMLSYSGKAIITVSDSFLTKGGKDKEIRKLLIDHDAIETVISLPKGTYRPYTESKASILILNKNKETYLRGQIRFIQASILEGDRKSVLLNVDEILKQYEGSYSDRGVELVKYGDLENGDNLSADLYLSKYFIDRELVKKGEAKYLKNLVDIQLGIQPKPNETAKEKEGTFLVKIENLHKNILGVELNLDGIYSFVTDYTKYYNKLIDKDCILIARIGDSLKPTIFRYKGVPILHHSNVVALIPKKEINIDYLYYRLSSENVEKQLHSITDNALIPFLNKKDIEGIVVPILSLEEQKKWVEEQTNILISEESKRLEQTKLLLGYKEQTEEAEINTIRVMAHQLKHNLTDLTTQAIGITEIIAKHNIGDFREYDSDNPILQKRDGFDVPQNKSLKEFSDALLKKALSLEDILKSIKDIAVLKLTYNEENVSNLLNTIKQDYDYLSIEITGDDCILPISKSHIKDLFDTLIRNALKHSQLNRNDLKISFHLKKEKGVVLIEYKNNGAPLDISANEYKAILTKSTFSDGDGIGGFYIDQIIKKHIGKLDITENLKTGVKMLITLPIINTNENE